MNIPFTPAQFFDVFKSYNQAIWPMQVGFYIIAVIAVLFALKNYPWSGRVVSVILSFFWLWMGIVYHFIYFAEINNAAYGFGILFIIQGLLIGYSGALQGRIHFRYSADVYGATGAALLFYALLLYPFLGYLQGRFYPFAPTFGLPCPTTIFTFGLFLWTNKRLPRWLLIIPLIWSVIGTSAAFKFGIKEDLGLLISGIVCFVLVLLRNRRVSKSISNL